jgi:hypothetical protein
LEEFIDKNGIAQCGSDFLQDIFLDKNVPIQQKKVLLQSLLQSNQDIKMKILNQHLKTIIEISCNSDTKQKLLQ